jgi:hypothetical protein
VGGGPWLCGQRTEKEEALACRRSRGARGSATTFDRMSSVSRHASAAGGSRREARRVPASCRPFRVALSPRAAAPGSATRSGRLASVVRRAFAPGRPERRRCAGAPPPPALPPPRCAVRARSSPQSAPERNAANTTRPTVGRRRRPPGGSTGPMDRGHATGAATSMQVYPEARARASVSGGSALACRR